MMKTDGEMRRPRIAINSAAVPGKPRKARSCRAGIHADAMQYTNLHTRLNFRPALSPAMLRRIEDCRRRSRAARTHAEKIALAATAPLSQP